MTEAVTAETIATADKLQRDGMRGQNAKLILANPVFHEAFDGMRSQIVEALAEASLREPDDIVLLVQQLKLLDRVKANFVSYVQVGESAESAIARQQARLDAEQERLDKEQNGIFARGMRQAQRARSALTPRTQ